MKRLATLGTRNMVANGQTVFDLSGIPDSYQDDAYRVLFLTLHFHLDVTVASAKTCDFIEILTWLNLIQLVASSHTFVNLNGWDLFLLDSYEHGTLVSPILAQLAAGANQFVDFDLVIRFNHPRQVEPADSAIPAEYFNDGQLAISNGPALINADTTLNAGTIQVTANLDRKNDLSVPAFPTLQACVKALDDELPAGIYKSLFIEAVNDKVFGFAAAANLTLLRYDAEGEDILKSMTPDQVLAGYHFEQADGPMAVGGMFPGPNGWGAHFASVGLMPLIWECKNINMSKVSACVDTNGRTLNMHNAGSLTTARYVMRYYQSQDVGMVNQKLSNVGVDPAQVSTEQKTVSKVKVNTRRLVLRQPGLRALPVKVQGARTLTAAGKYGRRLLISNK